MKTLSPLRYPGGKSRAVDIIYNLIPKDVKEICSPFFGGGSIELYCANQGIKVNGYDIFNPLVEFWQCLIEDGYSLSKEIALKHPLSKQDFYLLQKNQHTLNTKYERAAAFFVLNRSSFSGSTLSGGMSPQHPRFNQASIKKIENFKIENFTVENLSFELSIPKHQGCFFYLDPPYMIDGFLYGKKGNTHKDFNHNLLLEILQGTKKWILSYNDCPEILRMYQNYNIIKPNWKYGMSSNKDSKEVIITNF